MVRMVRAQAAYQLRLFVRSPRALIAAAATPLALMVMLAAISDHTTEPGYHAGLAASMAALGIASTCYTTLAASIVASRDAGVLKRLLATPMPIWVHLTGRVVATVAVACAQTVVLVVVAAIAYGASGLVTVAAVSGLLVGAVALCAIGLAVAQLVPRGDSAATVLSTTLLPVVLLSGIFFPAGDLPGWVGWLAQASPLTHLVALLRDDPAGRTVTVHFVWLIGWTALAAAFTLWRMRAVVRR